jgi:hypothetical protein
MQLPLQLPLQLQQRGQLMTSQYQGQVLHL